MSKKQETCRCGAPMTYYSHAKSWRCNQTGQLSANCNQVPHGGHEVKVEAQKVPVIANSEPEPEEAD